MYDDALMIENDDRRRMNRTATNEGKKRPKATLGLLSTSLISPSAAMELVDGENNIKLTE